MDLGERLEGDSIFIEENIKAVWCDCVSGILEMQEEGERGRNKIKCEREEEERQGMNHESNKSPSLGMISTATRTTATVSPLSPLTNGNAVAQSGNSGFAAALRKLAKQAEDPRGSVLSGESSPVSSPATSHSSPVSTPKRGSVGSLLGQTRGHGVPSTPPVVTIAPTKTSNGLWRADGRQMHPVGAVPEEYLRALRPFATSDDLRLASLPLSLDPAAAAHAAAAAAAYYHPAYLHHPLSLPRMEESLCLSALRSQFYSVPAGGAFSPMHPSALHLHLPGGRYPGELNHAALAERSPSSSGPSDYTVEPSFPCRHTCRLAQKTQPSNTAESTASRPDKGRQTPDKLGG
ncbi:hypothetical protein F2P81_007129 [Scophthalmus maximus]|uniref:Genetic suppressor element-like domain-containing protein n=1 Tax=Scophthalmus maximus TaxID=52904 RepID=A0A6A4TEG2_SCOMX|nr:hypothetical protein F2P81_007129 [Scophthalmus maximus]